MLTFFSLQDLKQQKFTIEAEPSETVRDHLHLSILVSPPTNSPVVRG